MIDSKTINKLDERINGIKAAMDSGDYSLATHLFIILQSEITDMHIDINNILTKIKNDDYQTRLNSLDESNIRMYKNKTPALIFNMFFKQYNTLLQFCFY